MLDGEVARLGRGPATVGELAAPHGLTLSAIMQHLLVLEGARRSTRRARRSEPRPVLQQVPAKAAHGNGMF